jgi:AmmeMemoRadiSam system protein B
MKRKMAVAGQFYDRSKVDLIEQLDKSFNDKKFGVGDFVIKKGANSRSIMGGIVPHAGYAFSGSATASTLKSIISEGVPDTVVIFGTSHTGYSSISIMTSGEWETPFGDIEIDSELANAILSKSDLIKNDESAFFGFPHGREHNIEVQLPFLKYLGLKAKKEIKIVPIVVGINTFIKLKDLGESVGHSIAKTVGKKDVVILASSDMTHKEVNNASEPKDELDMMRKADEQVISAIKEYDWKNTLEHALNTTVCGPQTITTAMIACKELGAKNAEILKYYNSYEKQGGDGTCDYCVGYLSAVFKK